MTLEFQAWPKTPRLFRDVIECCDKHQVSGSIVEESK